jgi:hypothetical protein
LQLDKIYRQANSKPCESKARGSTWKRKTHPLFKGKKERKEPVNKAHKINKYIIYS